MKIIIIVGDGDAADDDDGDDFVVKSFYLICHFCRDNDLDRG